MSGDESTQERSPRVMRAAARLRVTCDRKIGVETPEWIKELAKPTPQEEALYVPATSTRSRWRRMLARR
jgi:hypothetical protein